MTTFENEMFDAIESIRNKHHLTVQETFLELLRLMPSYYEFWTSDIVSRKDLEHWRNETRDQIKRELKRELMRI